MKLLGARRGRAEPAVPPLGGFAALDLETTGLSPRTDRVVEGGRPIAHAPPPAIFRYSIDHLKNECENRIAAACHLQPHPRAATALAAIVLANSWIVRHKEGLSKGHDLGPVRPRVNHACVARPVRLVRSMPPEVH
jgi:hypothetical protein